MVIPTKNAAPRFEHTLDLDATANRCLGELLEVVATDFDPSDGKLDRCRAWGKSRWDSPVPFPTIR